MEVIIIILVLGIVLLAFLGRGDGTDREVSEVDRARHRKDDNSHIYYWKDGELVHEQTYCWGCMQNTAEAIARKGYKIEQVVLGKHNTGDLS